MKTLFKKCSVLALTFAGLIVVEANAVPVVFSFHDGSTTIGSGLDLDAGGSNGTSLVSGVTLTAEAFLGGATAGTVFNGSGDGFGINATGTGDDTARFDNDLGIESMVFSFDTAGTFTSLDLRYIEETADEAVLIFNGGGTYQLNTTTALSGADDFNIGESFTSGQQITLQISGSAGANENFGLESITIDAVPEPSSFVLISLGLSALYFIRRRR